jgi:hypothetical protein
MVDFWVPLHSLLGRIVYSGKEGARAFALTLSNEGGLTIEKHMRKTSVWG